MTNLKIAVAQRHIEYVGVPTYIDGKRATNIDLTWLEYRLKRGLVRATAQCHNGIIYYTTEA